MTRPTIEELAMTERDHSKGASTTSPQEPPTGLREALDIKIAGLAVLAGVPHPDGELSACVACRRDGALNALTQLAATPVSSAGQGELHREAAYGMAYAVTEGKFTEALYLGQAYLRATQPSSDVVGAPSDDDNEEDGDGR